MNVQHRDEVVKCPSPTCKNPIHISVGRWPGGINDSGGWVLKCANCDHVFPLDVKNPDNASRVKSGATILGSWDNEVGNREELLVAHNIVDGTLQAERLLLLQQGEVEDFYDLNSRPLYRCGACCENLEVLAYAAIRSHLDIVCTALAGYLSLYLAQSAGSPVGISIWLDVLCACGAAHRARFYREFSEKLPQAASEFWLVDLEGDKRALDVDGIYSRDDCIAILEKLLLRWRALHSAVLLAAPFIGFDFPGARKKVPDLWNWVLKYTDPSKTFLITRKATFKLFKDASKDTEQDVEFLKSWGLLNPTVAALDEKKAFFKTDFHAKFYCGISANNVEILVGSFNIHEGSYVENIHLLTYSFEDFKQRYLLGMKMFFDLNLLAKRRSVLEILINDGKVTDCKETWHSGSLSSD